MRNTFLAKVAVPTLGLAALTVAATISVATAEPPAPPPGNGCETGYQPRLARPGDDVCVTRDFARRTAQENANPKANKEPNGGAYGPETCVSGFVWREAFDGDTICVTPDVRAQNKAASADPNAHKAPANAPGGTNAPQPTPDGTNAPKPTPEGSPPPEQTAQRKVTFEVTGSGTVYSIDMDPSSARVGENTAVPFTRTITIGPDVGLLQLIAVGKTGSQGCRILLDGKVVAEQPVGSAHCSYAIP